MRSEIQGGISIPEITRTLTVHARQEKAWHFLSDFNQMPKCLDGFQSVRIIDDTHSIWTLKVEITFATRLIEAQATITRKDPPNQLEFMLTGLNEKVNGEGSLHLQPADENETKVEFRFRLEASGIAAALTNALIARVLPKLTASFEDCLRRSLEGK